MLILTRGIDESVILEVQPSPDVQRIELLVTRIVGGNKARLGFQAGRAVRIVRSELCQPREEWEQQ